MNSSAYYLTICIIMHQFPRRKAKGTLPLRFIHLLQTKCKDQKKKLLVTKKNVVRNWEYLIDDCLQGITL